jgi:hypothetical protein
VRHRRRDQGHTETIAGWPPTAARAGLERAEGRPHELAVGKRAERRGFVGYDRAPMSWPATNDGPPLAGGATLANEARLRARRA